MRRRNLAVLVVAVLMTLGSQMAPANAVVFKVRCRASVIRTVGVEPTVANRAGVPCVDDAAYFNPAAVTPAGEAKTDTVDADYDYLPSATAVAGPMCLPVPVPSICFRSASSVAYQGFNTATGVLEWRGRAAIGGLTIDGEDAGALITFGGYANLGAAGTLRWNVAMPERSGLAVRALWFDGPGDVDIVVAEAVIGSA